jgi:hypothetical protein
MENFELSGGGKRFGELIVSLTKDDPNAFGTLYLAASDVSRLKLAKVSDFKPAELAKLIRQDTAATAFFLSVLKAMNNPALPADASLVKALASFHITAFDSTYQQRRAFVSGVSMAMLENPECRVEWLTSGNAHLLASLANNLWTGKDFRPPNSFDLLTLKVSSPAFSPSQLTEMVEMALSPLTVNAALQ